MLEYKEIEYGSSDYDQELKLRDKILRLPIGLSIKDDPTHLEENECHLGCFDRSHLVGCLILRTIENDRIKMRQVAVDESYQSRGIGRGLIAFGEKKASRVGAAIIELHAREHVIGFYENLGYICDGEAFLEVGMLHKKMMKKISLKG